MLTKKFSSKLLQLPLNKIKIVKEDLSNEKEWILTLQIRRKSKYCKCPYCNKKTKYLYDNSIYIHKWVRHLINFKYQVFLDVEKRRFYCPTCNRDVHEQYEFIPYKLKDQKDDKGSIELKRVRSKSHTNLFEEFVLYEWATSSVAEIARRWKVGKDKLWSIIWDLDFDKLKRRWTKYMEEYWWDLYLWIDEHSFSWRDMVLVIIEHSTKRVVAVLPTVKKADLKAWLESLPDDVVRRIKWITTDMTNNYQNTVLETLWLQIVEVVDKYHIVQLANKVLDKVRQLSNWMIHVGHYWHNIIDVTQKKWIKKRKWRKKWTKNKTTLKQDIIKQWRNESIAGQKYRSLKTQIIWRDQWTRLFSPDSEFYKPITVEHYLSETYRTLFLTWEEKLTHNQQNRLNQIFIEFDPEWYVFEAYNAKEMVRSFLNEKDEDLLNETIIYLQDSEHYQLKILAKTLIKHRQWILNYFEYWITNARVEWKNNKAKLIKRMSYWYRSKTNYIKKLMFAL